MRVYTRYRSPPRRGRLQSLSYWLVALAGLGVLAWVFWESGREPRRPAAPPKTPTNSLAARPLSGGVPYPSGTAAPPQPAIRATTAPPAVVIAPPAGPQRTASPPATVTAPPVAPVVPPGPGTDLPAKPPQFPTNLVLNGRWDSPRAVGTVFEMQLALAQSGFSSGSLDGRTGAQSRAALRAFQARSGLSITGVLDPATKNLLKLDSAPITELRVESADLARLRPVSRTWVGKSKQDRLDYQTLLELVAEKSWSHPRLIRELNPTVNWSGVAPGTVLRVPTTAPRSRTRAASLKIELSGKVLRAYDTGGNLFAFMPCSIAQRVSKRPIGTLRVTRVANHPVYTFNPATFPESAEARRLTKKLDLPPGPNNPVGVAWIGLDKPGYGIHGTPEPEQVGRTESHGCFRLANWNAEYLASIVSVGTPVHVEP